MELENKVLKIKFKDLVEDATTADQGDQYIVEAVVSVFNNVDFGGDVIENGAFAKSLLRKMPVGCWSHDWSNPIAKTLEAKETTEGLYIKGQFLPSVQKSKEAYDLIKSGVVTEYSIGYEVVDAEYDVDGHRHLKEVNLFEWSPVLVGMNPLTHTVDVKEADPTIETTTAPVEEVKPTEETKPVEETKPTEETITPVETIKPLEEQPAPKDETVVVAPEAKAGRKFSSSDEAQLRDWAEQIGNISTQIVQMLDSATQTDGKASKMTNDEKVLLIRQVAKEMDKKNEFILKITK